MKLASYHGNRAGIMKLGNIAIRWRLSGPFSHTEIVFDETDKVDDLMPDGSTAAVDGKLWSTSAVGLERLPSWSSKRANKLGGVRFKRIDFSDNKWTLLDISDKFDARKAALKAKQLEGTKYDWWLIGKFLLWFIPQDKLRVTCNEYCGEILGFPEPWRFDPCSFHFTVEFIMQMKEL